MLGTGKTFRSRVEAIAESGLLPNYVSGNIDKEYFGGFTASNVDNLNNEECREFIALMDTIGCHCCKEESLDEIYQLVSKALMPTEDCEHIKQGWLYCPGEKPCR